MDSSGRQWDDQGSREPLEGACLTKTPAATGTATEETGSQLDYLRLRACAERRAAAGATDMRVNRVHLEMAQRYEALVDTLEQGSQARLRLVS
ncbi:MAG TPA: hypothetical protein VNR86_03400 [Sphingomicrobium sp.]|nr:hypothetical protein [Sphingomicrobium sp.]